MIPAVRSDEKLCILRLDFAIEIHHIAIEIHHIAIEIHHVALPANPAMTDSHLSWSFITFYSTRPASRTNKINTIQITKLIYLLILIKG